MGSYIDCDHVDLSGKEGPCVSPLADLVRIRDGVADAQGDRRMRPEGPRDGHQVRSQGLHQSQIGVESPVSHRIVATACC